MEWSLVFDLFLDVNGQFSTGIVMSLQDVIEAVRLRVMECNAWRKRVRTTVKCDLMTTEVVWYK